MGIQAAQARDTRSFEELFAQCEIQSIATRVGAEIATIAMRIAATVIQFFQPVIQFVIEISTPFTARILGFLPDSIATRVSSIREQIVSNLTPHQPANRQEQRNSPSPQMVLGQLGALAGDFFPESIRSTLAAHIGPFINNRMNTF